MVRSIRISISDLTNPKDLDLHFRRAWLFNEQVRLVMDTTDCKQLSLKRILSMKDVLDRHRPQSKKYIDHTVVLVRSRLAQFILRTGLFIIRPERPVFINIRV
jgi:hypothetical protein